MVVAIPFVYNFGIKPWTNFGGFDTKIEKTALETTGTLEDKTLTFKGADMYLSIAVSDAEQPDPNKVRFYIGSNGNQDDKILNKNQDEDGFKKDDNHTGYYQVYYSTQHKPSTINNKVSIGKKVITATGYNPDEPINLLLKPRTDTSLSGDVPDMAWYVYTPQEGYVGDKPDTHILTGQMKTKCDKHSWLVFSSPKE